MKEKMVLIGLLCAGALCVGSVLAGEADGAKKERPAKPDMAGKKFAEADTDGNGVVSLEEFKAMQARREEAMKKRMGDKYDAERAAKRPSAEEMFKKLDADNSGGLSKAELAPPPPAPKVPRVPKEPKAPKEPAPAKEKTPAAVNPPL